MRRTVAENSEAIQHALELGQVRLNCYHSGIDLAQLPPGGKEERRTKPPVAGCQRPLCACVPWKIYEFSCSTRCNSYALSLPLLRPPQKATTAGMNTQLAQAAAAAAESALETAQVALMGAEGDRRDAQERAMQDRLRDKEMAAEAEMAAAEAEEMAAQAVAEALPAATAAATSSRELVLRVCRAYAVRSAALGRPSPLHDLRPQRQLNASAEPVPTSSRYHSSKRLYSYPHTLLSPPSLRRRLANTSPGTRRHPWRVLRRPRRRRRGREQAQERWRWGTMSRSGPRPPPPPQRRTPLTRRPWLRRRATPFGSSLRGELRRH